MALATEIPFAWADPYIALHTSASQASGGASAGGHVPAIAIVGLPPIRYSATMVVPASAAASAAAWLLRCCAIALPPSTTRATKAIRAMRTPAKMARTWPPSSQWVIRERHMATSAVGDRRDGRIGADALDGHLGGGAERDDA